MELPVYDISWRMKAGRRMKEQSGPFPCVNAHAYEMWKERFSPESGGLQLCDEIKLCL